MKYFLDRWLRRVEPPGQPVQVNQPALITVLLHKTLFTAKEAAFGFAIGAVVGFGLGVVLVHSRLLQRGLLPYIVASQTIPILAIAPMVIIWVNPKLPPSLQGWGAVAVIAAYLTFFPVAINSLRGLQSADPRALELMRTYGAGRWAVLWKVRVPSSLPYVFAALKIAATASVVGAIIGELPSGMITAARDPSFSQAREITGYLIDNGKLALSAKATPYVGPWTPSSRRRQEAAL